MSKNTERFKEQMSSLGLSYDFDREFLTSDPKYYKWTQWMFLKMYEKGIAYEAYGAVNWCSDCLTVLANEDLEDGKCERCSTPIQRRKLRQWFLRITKYADRLLEDLNELTEWARVYKDITKELDR